MRNYNKRLPQRTCIACRQVKPKGEMVRIVCITGDHVEIDTSGKKAGRGAYLCHEERCWEMGLKSNRLEHSLRTTLSPANREELITYAKGLFPKEKIQ